MDHLTPEFLANGLLWFLVFVFSTTCHEAAHAWSALRLGDSTAYHGGQVSLNPLPHIRREPFGMVLVPLLSYFLMKGGMIGWASAPYDPLWAYRNPKKSALMSLAGPAANLALAVFSGLLLKIGLAGEWIFRQSVDGEAQLAGIGMLLWIAFRLNLLLMVFNLIPLPPLDGSGVIKLFMSDQVGRRYLEFLHEQPMIAWAGILVAWRVMDYVYPPVMAVALRLLAL